MFRRTIKNLKQRYLNDNHGHFALWLGVTAFPILVATTYVVDFRGAEADRSEIKRSLDSAVLATVSNDTLNEDEKQSVAKEIFNTHYTGDMKLDLNVKVSDGRVGMSAKGIKEASLSKSVGAKGFPVDETSVAVMTRQNTICVLALAKDGRDKLRFIGQTKFNSPTCSVQSNSDDDKGVLSDTRNTPIAKSFCSAGGARGKFDPAMRGQCRAVDDPYEDRAVPNSGACMPDSVFNGGNAIKDVNDFLEPIVPTNLGLPPGWHEPDINITNNGNGKHTHQHCHVGGGHCHSGSHHVGTVHALRVGKRLEGLGVSRLEIQRLIADYGLSSLLTTESANFTGSNTTFYPGTYCGGLTVDGKDVIFEPGEYIIKDGPLTFKNGATATANNVSFILKGKDTVVTVETGAYVWLKAPSTGPMAGMAIYQDKDGDVATTPMGEPMGPQSLYADDGNGSGPGAGKQYPTAINLLSSGGELNVTGTMYFPTQALDVLGNSVLGARAPATSFIAHQVTFAGETEASVSVDYIKGDIPAMLPRSDDGARLVE